MRKALIPFVLLFLGIASPVASRQLDKVGPALNYWYNFYFDPEWIEHVEDSMNSRQPIRLGDSLEYYPPPRIEPGEPWLPLSRAPIEFRNGVPYVEALARYSGDGTDLSALGVSQRYVRGAKTATVRFALQLLPEITSLHTVEYIPDRAQVNLQPNDVYLMQPDGLAKACGTIKVNNIVHSRILVGLFNQAGTFFKLEHLTLNKASDNDEDYRVFNSLPAGFYFLCITTRDSLVSRVAVSRIPVIRDSCTLVNLPVPEEQIISPVRFIEWQKTDSNVVPRSAACEQQID